MLRERLPLPDLRRKVGELLPKVENYVVRRGKRYAHEFRDFFALMRMIWNKEITLPFWAFVAIISTATYILSPVDIMPDLMPLGLIDDVFLALYTFNNVRDKIRWKHDGERSGEHGFVQEVARGNEENS